MLAIQIIGILFALFAFIVTIIKFKEKKISIKEFIFWSILWFCIAVIAIVPWTTTIIANFIGIRRGIDVVIYLSIIVLFYLIFRIYVKIINVEREITKLVREEALKKKRK